MNTAHWHTTNNLPHYVAESGPRRYETFEEALGGLAADMLFVADAIAEYLRDLGEEDYIPGALNDLVRYRSLVRRILTDPSQGGTWSVGEDEWSMDKCDLPNCKYGERGMS